MPELPQIAAEGGIEQTNFPKPEIAPGAASRGIYSLGEETSNQVADLGERMLNIQRTLQFNDAQGRYHIAADDLTRQAFENPKLRASPDAAAKWLNDQLTPIQDQIRQQYPMADVHGQLTRNMALWTDSRTRTLWHDAWHNQLQDTVAQLRPDGPTAMRAMSVGLTALDPKDRQMAVTNYLGQIKAAKESGFLSDAEADDYATKFQYTVRKGQFDLQARQNPAHTLLLDSAHPPEGVLPEWIDAAKKAASEQLQAGSRAAVADADAKIGGLAQNAMAAEAAGKPAGGLWDQYMQAGGEQKVYEAHTGRQFIRPSVDPTLRDNYIGQLKNARAEDVPFIVDEAEQAYRNGALGSMDIGQISLQAVRARSENATADKQREIHWRNDVLGEYEPKGTDPMARFGVGSMTPKVNRTALDAAMNDAWAQAKGDPVKAKKIVDDQFGKYRLLDTDGSAKRSVGILVPGRTTGAP